MWKTPLRLLVFALLAGLVVLEVLLRTNGHESQSHRWLVDLTVEDGSGQRRGRPLARGWYAADEYEVFVSHDERGRRRPAQPLREGARRRAVLLGGVSVWGMGVGQGELVSDWLMGETTNDWSVENWGSPEHGFGPIRRALDEALAESSPTDVLAFLGASDLSREPPAFSTCWTSLEDYSLAARFLHEQWLRAVEGGGGDQSDSSEWASPDVGRILAEMKEAAGRRGSSFSVVFLPEGGDLRSEVSRARDLLREEADARSIHFIDLLPVFRSSPSKLRFRRLATFPALGSWSSLAHFRTARGLLEAPPFRAADVAVSARGPGRHVPPDDPAIQYSGRMDRGDPHKYRFDWPGVTIRIRLHGDSVRFLLRAERPHDYFDVLVDGRQHIVWLPGRGDRDLVLDRLGPGSHDIEIVKRTDAVAPIYFEGIWLPPGGSLLPTTPLPQRRILVLGASWAHGYGNEGTLYGHLNEGRRQRTCADKRRLSRVSASWAFVLGELLDAEVHLVSKGGSGVIRNYESRSPRSDDPLPVRVDRSLSSDATTHWDSDAWVPDLVVINLGENDFSSEPFPAEEEFIEGYRALVRDIRSAYPKAHILAFNLEEEETVLRLVGEALERQRREGDGRLDSLTYRETPRSERGCDNHPGRAEHRRLAAQIAARVRARVAAWGDQRAGGEGSGPQRTAQVLRALSNVVAPSGR